MGGSLLATKKVTDGPENMPLALTVARAAKVADRSRRTIRRWVREGLVEAERPRGDGGPIYIRRRSLLRLLGVEE